ncbi:MAG: hypothetical protein D6679_13895 [Candidatus Hydrogenedentota bacterium]|nr:MAG: hypothetical protein D6679_13895 [Candidatus Hydrogenedentota bacterium]
MVPIFDELSEAEQGNQYSSKSVPIEKRPLDHPILRTVSESNRIYRRNSVYNRNEIFRKVGRRKPLRFTFENSPQSEIFRFPGKR